MPASKETHDVVRSGGLVHYIAGCDICDGVGNTNPKWCSKNARSVASKHTAKTGHETWVELGHSYTYRKE